MYSEKRENYRVSRFLRRERILLHVRDARCGVRFLSTKRYLFSRAQHGRSGVDCAAKYKRHWTLVRSLTLHISVSTAAVPRHRTHTSRTELDVVMPRTANYQYPCFSGFLNSSSGSSVKPTKIIGIKTQNFQTNYLSHIDSLMSRIFKQKFSKYDYLNSNNSTFLYIYITSKLLLAIKFT